MFISAQMYQRSADVFLGLPFNIASYSLLLHLVARSVSMLPDELVIQIGNAHLYSDHFEQARVQLERKILVPPKLEVIRVDLENPEQDDVKLWGYFSWPGISARLSV